MGGRDVDGFVVAMTMERRDMHRTPPYRAYVSIVVQWIDLLSAKAIKGGWKPRRSLYVLRK